jgi:hypothetical protein
MACRRLQPAHALCLRAQWGGYEPWTYQAHPNSSDTLGSSGTGIKTNEIKSYGLWSAVDTTTGKIAW